jgi:hypothetical protein
MAQQIGAFDGLTGDVRLPEERVSVAVGELSDEVHLAERLEQDAVQLARRVTSPKRRPHDGRVQHDIGRERIDPRIEVAHPPGRAKGMLLGHAHATDVERGAAYVIGIALQYLIDRSRKDRITSSQPAARQESPARTAPGDASSADNRR